jgi:hypothetical protein
MNNNLEGGNLIFLISQPRSGSTLLQLMLSGSSAIATTTEPWIALHPIFALRDGVIDTKYGANIAKTALLEFLKESGAGIEFYNKQISSLLLALYNQAIKHQKKSYFLDKTPRYYNIIDDLHELFPLAKFIILLRNPLAVLNSILKTWVKDDYSVLVNNVDDLMIAPHKLVKFLTEHPKICTKVKYEELVTNPETVIKKICMFLGIEFSANMIDYGERIHSEWKFGDQVGIRRSTLPNNESVNKWKDALESPQEKLLAISYLESLGPQLIKDMGYEYDEIKSAISLPASNSHENLFSWSSVMNVVEGLTNINDVRRAAFCVLLEEGHLKNKTNREFSEWSDIVNKMVINVIRPKINQLSSELNQAINKIDGMQNTLSWKMTAPLRNSRLLKVILTKFRNLK